MKTTTWIVPWTLFAALGLGAVVPPAWAEDAARPAAAATTTRIVVQNGYHPDRIVVKEGAPIRLAFVRQEYSGCTLEVVFPTLGIRRKLPPNEPVVIDLGAPAAGEIPFHCGMNMIHGLVVVEPKE